MTPAPTRAPPASTVPSASLKIPRLGMVTVAPHWGQRAESDSLDRSGVTGNGVSQAGQ